MPTQSIVIKVATDGDLRSYVGNDGQYFDLVDFNKVRAFNVLDTLPICRFQVGSLSSKVAGDVNMFLEVLNPCTPRNLCMEDIMVFLKLYDPEQKQLRYIGTLFVKATSKPAEILPKLRNLAYFCADEEIELYEEIRFKPSVLCEFINVDDTFRNSQIGNGDIICYQKSPKSWKQHTLPSVQSFLEHVHDLKDEERRKICALEEDIVVLKCQSDLQIEKGKNG